VSLTKIQTDILRLLASQRDPESYVAGAAPLNRYAPRYSADIDVFHDDEQRVASTVEKDIKTLEAAGYKVRTLRSLPTICTVEVTRENEATHLEWGGDSPYRFFPTLPDDTFGYVLHPVDLATNKVMAAAGRHEVRDLVDLVTIHETILPLGAVVWAAVQKAPGFTPEGLVAEIRRNSNYPAAEWRAIASAEPIDPAVITTKLRTALDEAEAFALRMPTDKIGLLFLEGTKVVQPDPEHLDKYETHAGQKQGHWPTNPEISAAMFPRYNKKQSNGSNDPKP